MFLKPDLNVISLNEINFSNFDIKIIIFDLDSTLMKSKSGFFTNEIKIFLENLRKKYKIYIASNNKNAEYINKVQTQTDCLVIGHANKPSPKTITEIINANSVEPNQVIIVGDRPLTDILAGKLAGTKTILVDSISKDEEPKLTRFVRFIERLFIKK